MTIRTFLKNQRTRWRLTLFNLRQVLWCFVRVCELGNGFPVAFIMAAEEEGAIRKEPEKASGFVSTEAIVLGFILGGLMFYVAKIHHHGHEQFLPSDPIVQTIFVALYLTMAVGFCGFKLPAFFAGKNPRLAVWTLSFLCGHVSLFFDSFAVVLLLSSLTLMPLEQDVLGYRPKEGFRFKAFGFKVICAFNALTVGGGFYIGELWGLPYFISSHLDNPLAGLPLLAVVTPYCAFTSCLAARYFCVDIEPVKFDKAQLIATIEIVFLLVVVILTHDPLMCIGGLLLWTAVTGRTIKLLKNTLHEIEEGAGNALGLILVAYFIQKIPGAKEWFAEHLSGFWLFLCAAVSSPFAGAMAPGATEGDLETFYTNISLIMLGAPMFVSSSLVAIVVFKESLSYEDLPEKVRVLLNKIPLLNIQEEGVIQEALMYTLLIVPLNLGLGVCLLIGNLTGLFPWLYRLMH